MTGVTFEEHRAVIGRMKRRFLLYAAGLLSVSLLASGALFARVQASVDDIERAAAATVAQSLTGCQRGNELRRAVRVITGHIPGARARVDADALTPTDCRYVVLGTTGVDPGPVNDYVE